MYCGVSDGEGRTRGQKKGGEGRSEKGEGEKYEYGQRQIDVKNSGMRRGGKEDRKIEEEDKVRRGR